MLIRFSNIRDWKDLTIWILQILVNIEFFLKDLWLMIPEWFKMFIFVMTCFMIGYFSGYYIRI